MEFSRFLSLKRPEMYRCHGLHESSTFGSPRPFSFKSKRLTSFGYGQKQCLPPTILRNARELPGANAYKIPSQFEALQRVSFGLSREFFEKNYIPGRVPLSVAEDMPGPGHYSVQRKPKGGFSLVGKGSAFQKVKGDEGPFSFIIQRLNH